MNSLNYNKRQINFFPAISLFVPALHSTAIRLTVLIVLAVLTPFILNSANTLTTETGNNFDGNGFSTLSSSVTFVINNTSQDSITITGVDMYLRTENDGSIATLWYTGSDISSFPAIEQPDWNSIISSTFPLDISANGYYELFDNLSFVMPPDTKYRFAVETTQGIRYSTNHPTPNTFSEDNVHLHVHDYQINSANVGYGGGFPYPFNSPVAFTGRVHFTKGYCTEPPFAGNAVASRTEVCQGETFKAEIDSFSTHKIGQSYQWQSSLSGDPGTWNDIPGETGRVMYTEQYETTWYRAVVTCGSSSDTASAVKVETDTTRFNGNYTIDSSQPGGGNNFTSFSEVANKLNCVGVDGPVTFDIAPGNYIDQVFLDNVPGVSSTNTITFDGGHRDSVKIRYNPEASDEQFVFRIKEAPHVHIKNITIDISRAKWGWGVHLHRGAHNATIKNNRILADSLSNVSNHAGIVASASNTNETYNGYSADSILIANNTISGGYQNIVASGHTDTLLTGMVIENNILSAAYNNGIYLGSHHKAVVEGNEINGRSEKGNSSATAIFLQNVNNGFQITGNRVYNFSESGLSVTGSSGTSGDRGMIYNNMLGGGFTEVSSHAKGGIDISNSTFIDIYYNSINYDGKGGNAIDIFSSDSINIVNNSFAYTGGGDGFSFFETSSEITQFDHNNFYSNGSNFITYAGNSYSDLSSFQSATATNSNAVETDPGYVDTKDLSLISGNLTGEGLPLQAVTSDFFGNSRGTNSTVIGAHEFDQQNNDIGVFQIYVDADVMCINDSIPVYATIINYGSDTIYSADLHWSINGVDQNDTAFPGVLAPSDDTTIAIGSFVPDSLVIHEIIAYTSSPNNSADQNPNNDSSALTVKPGIESQTFTAGGLYADFLYTSDGINYLLKHGICGPVTIEVKPGTYETQFAIPEVPGASDSNDVTIDGAHADSVTFYYDKFYSSAGYHIIKLDGSKHINIQNLTLHSIGGTTGFGIHLTEGAGHISIKNNKIHTDNTATSEENHAGIIATGPDFIFTLEGSLVHNISMKDNIITGGYHGIYLVGDSDNRVNGIIASGNKITDSYQGIRLRYASDPEINNNTITSRQGTAFNNRGVYLDNVTNGFEISYNRIYSELATGIFLINAGGNSSDAAMIFNNMIGDGFSSGQATNSGGIIVSGGGSDNITLAHNTLFYDAPHGKALHISDDAAGINLLNNIFGFTGGGNGYPVFIEDSSSVDQFDYNLFYSDGFGFVHYSDDYFNLTTLRNNSSGNDSSETHYPGFNSNENKIEVNSPYIYRGGTPLNYIKDDYFNTPRDTGRPSIGAEEYIPDSNDLGVTEIISPGNNFCGDSNITVIVNVLNYGLKEQHTFDVEAEIIDSSGNKQYLQGTYNDTLELGESAWVHLGSANLLKGGNYTISAYISLNNDDDPANDTSYKELINIPSFIKPPEPQNIMGCQPDSFNLKVSKSDTGHFINWYSSPGQNNILHRDDTFTTPLIDTDTSFFTTASKDTPWNRYVGRNNRSGFGYYTSVDRYLEFDVHKDLLLDSVTVYLEEAGIVEIKLRDSNGSVIQTVTRKVYESGEKRIHLGLVIPEGNNYQLKRSHKSVPLYRNSSANYPYEIPDTITIHGTSHGQNNYYFFYNWRVGNIGCESNISESKITILDNTNVNVVKGDTFNGIFSNGTQNAPDTACSGGTITYEAVHPEHFPNEDFNKSWTFDAFQVETVNGTPAQNVNLSDPAACQNGFITFQPGKSEADSLFKIEVTTKFTESGCINVADRYVKVIAVPEPGFAAENFCVGDTVTFTNESSNSENAVYQWDFGDSQSSSATNPTHVFDSSGSYEVILSSTVPGGCTASDTQQVEITEAPQAAFSANEVCENDSTRFSNLSSANESLNYTWSFGDGNSSAVKNPVHHYDSAGIYEVTLKVETVNGCIDTVKQAVTVRENPVADFSADEACEGNPVTFTNESTGAANFEWKTAGNVISTDESFSHTFGDSGTFQVTLNASSKTGCNDTMTRSVTVHKSPEIVFSTENICAGDSAVFDIDTYIDDSLDITWNFGDGATSSDQNPAHFYQSAGNYDVFLYGTTTQGCTDSANQTITVKEKPVADFSASDVCVGDTSYFSNLSASDNGLTFHWMIDKGDTLSDQHVAHMFDEPGDYTVKLIAATGEGCLDSSEKTVTVHPSPEVDFSAESSCAEDTIHFNNHATGATNFQWYIDNTLFSEKEETLRVFNKAGMYDLTLRGISENNCKDSARKTLEINELPDADFVIEHLTDTPGIRLIPGDQGLPSYHWDFGDGNTSEETSPIHVYNKNGSYIIALQVSGPHGCHSESHDTVEISTVKTTTIPDQVQYFEVYPNPVYEDVTVSFNLNKPTKVEGTLYDMQGREVSNPVSSQTLREGQHVFLLNFVKANHAEGIYMLRISFDGMFVDSQLIYAR